MTKASKSRLLLNGEQLLCGDSKTIAVAWNNLTGANFKHPNKNSAGAPQGGHEEYLNDFAHLFNAGQPLVGTLTLLRADSEPESIQLPIAA